MSASSSATSTRKARSMFLRSPRDGRCGLGSMLNLRWLSPLAAPAVVVRSRCALRRATLQLRVQPRRYVKAHENRTGIEAGSRRHLNTTVGTIKCARPRAGPRTVVVAAKVLGELVHTIAILAQRGLKLCGRDLPFRHGSRRRELSPFPLHRWFQTRAENVGKLLTFSRRQTTK